MADDVVEDPRAELALVEQELVQIAKEADDLRQELGNRTDGAGDAVDQTTLIEQLNVNESLLDDLHRRRDDLRQLLGEAPDSPGV